MYSITANHDPLGDGISSVQYIQHCGSDKMIVHAARVSYAADSDDNNFTFRDKKLLKYLMENSHGSPLEHTLITFRVRAPLYVIQEMLRHRIGTSFNQESHRYVEPDKKEELLRKFYVPRQFRRQSEINKQGSSIDILSGDDASRAIMWYKSACEKAFEEYYDLLGLGVAREIARGVLPHSTYSSLYFTVNMRSLLHFLELREDPNAQWEIQQYAKAFREIATELFPATMGIWQELKERTC